MLWMELPCAVGAVEQVIDRCLLAAKRT